MPSYRGNLTVGMWRAYSNACYNELSKACRSISHTLSRVTSRGGAASLLAVAGRIAGTDAGLCEAFSCPWPPSSPFDTLREIERTRFVRLLHEPQATGTRPGARDACTAYHGNKFTIPFAAVCSWTGPHNTPILCHT